MRFSFLIVAILLSNLLFSQNWEITPWYENKKAAVSVTMDDQTSGQFTYALPAMNARNIKGTYFATTNNPNWTSLQTAAFAGHEIASHTIHHWDLSTLTDFELENELKGSHDDIVANIPGTKFVSFAYPFGIGWGSNADHKRVRDFTMKYYINARGVSGSGGNYGLIGYDRYYDFELSRYDNYYYQTGSYVMGPTISIADFTSVMDLAITNGGWSIILYHGIQDGGYNEISSAVFQEQMDTIVSRNDKFWITTFGDASRYHQERNSAILAEKLVTDYTWVFELTDGYEMDSIFNHPLTIRLEIPEWMDIDSVTQDGSIITYIDEDTLIQFNAIPDGVDIVIYKANNFIGCDGGSPGKPYTPYLSYNSDTVHILSWDKLSELSCISSYQIYMNGVQIGSTINSEFYLPSLKIDSSYSFYITADNDHGVSENSEILIVTVELTAPDAPVGLIQIGETSNSITISWEPVDDALGISGYEIYVAAEFFAFTLDTFYTFNNLQPQSDYYIYLKTRDMSGNISAPGLLFVGITSDIGTLYSEIEIGKEVEIRIFPNPSNDIFSVSIITNKSDEYTLSAYNLSGEKVQEKQIHSNKECRFGENLNAGIYLVNLSNRNISKTFKVVKY